MGIHQILFRCGVVGQPCWHQHRIHHQKAVKRSTDRLRSTLCHPRKQLNFQIIRVEAKIHTTEITISRNSWGRPTTDNTKEDHLWFETINKIKDKNKYF